MTLFLLAMRQELEATQAGWFNAASEPKKVA